MALYDDCCPFLFSYSGKSLLRISFYKPGYYYLICIYLDYTGESLEMVSLDLLVSLYLILLFYVFFDGVLFAYTKLRLGVRSFLEDFDLPSLSPLWRVFGVLSTFSY